MDNRKIYLILGANGFIGSHLVEHVARHENVHVRAFDRFSREPEFTLSSNVEIIRGDIFKKNDLQAALKGVDYVIHAFSATTPFTSDNDPYADVTDNLIKSIEIFELCVHEHVKKIGFVSSGGAVYGTAAENGVVNEDTMPLPISPYGINKLAIEHYLEYFKRKYAIDYVAYRLTNPYGPRQRMKKNQGAIPAFLENIKQGNEITIYGDGTASRDYIFIDDAAKMIADTFERENKSPIYNIGSGQQTALSEILGAMKMIIPAEGIKITYKEAPKTFLWKTQVSVDRFKEEFGEFEMTPLQDGLKKTIG